MKNLFNIGLICYGIAIAGIGLQAIYLHDFPYILALPEHFPAPAHIVLAIIFGIMFTIAGASVILEKRTRQISFLFGIILLFIFCFYYIPYELLTSPNYMHLEEWENAAKELTLAGGAFVVAGSFAKTEESQHDSFFSKLIPFGAILYAITMINYGILHFLVGKGASTLVPSWIPWHLFWIYFCGAALLGSGVTIIFKFANIFKIKITLITALLGAMILTWFIILHIPRVIVAAPADRGDEITSAFFALAYSGIAFVISRATSKKVAGPLT